MKPKVLSFTSSHLNGDCWVAIQIQFILHRKIKVRMSLKVQGYFNNAVKYLLKKELKILLCIKTFVKLETEMFFLMHNPYKKSRETFQVDPRRGLGGGGSY